MKKSQLRANLLDESSAFVTPPSKDGSSHFSSQNQHQPRRQIQNQPSHAFREKPMQYVSHPLAQQPQYPHDYNNSYDNGNANNIVQGKDHQGGYYNQQYPHMRPAPQPQQSRAYPVYNDQQQQQQKQQMKQQSNPRSHNSFPLNSVQRYNVDDQQRYIDEQRGVYNGSHPSHYPHEFQTQVPQQQPYYPPYPDQQLGSQNSRSFNQSVVQQISNSNMNNNAQLKPIRSTSNTYQQQVEPFKASTIPPMRATDQIFSIGYSDDEDVDDMAANQKKNNQSLFMNDGNNNTNTTATDTTDNNNKSAIEQDKIQQLEEKIQRLERVLALQDLESKITSFSDSSMGSPSAKINEKSIIKQTEEKSGNSNTLTASAPPLPPPPPTNKKSMMSSPKANLFLSEFDPGLESKANHDIRLSSSSLIPTDKSLSDQSLDDMDDTDQDNTFGYGADEPPPSYEELEKSGTLTYSQSIYRTGFEKAGYQMDHVAVPYTPTKMNNKINKELLSRRKIPSQINDDMFEKAALKSSISSIPTIDATTSDTFQAPIRSLTRESMETSVLAKSLPTPPVPPIQHTPTVAKVPAPVAKASQLSISTNNVPTATSSQFQPPKKSVLNTVNKQPSVDSLYTAKTVKTEPINIIKYSTDMSFEVMPNGVIKPILPSRSKESLESTISKFRKTRDDALSDYKQFTPKVQFYWAILLLETLSKSEILSKMTIDGKLRKSPISYKKLKKQRLMFFTTAIKVLEKLIQIAPNDTRARLYLGDIYSGGIHPGLIERDEKLGYQLFYDAATKQNDPVACYRIACCLESGVGCKQDIPKSIIFFERGATLGDPSSMCQLGMMHFAGVNGCIQDISLSIAYHKQAYETLRSRTIMSFDPLISLRSFQDARGALYTLAKLHQTDTQILCLTDMNDEKTKHTIEELKYANVWCNTSRALKYYLEAGKLGHNESQACLGYYYSQGFFPTHLFKSDKEAHNGIADPLDARKSIYWFSKAAADGHTYAALGLARWYGSGGLDNDGKVILKRDEQQAFLWGRKAADGGELAEAEFMIGVCFEQGFGVEQNLVMAANYFERSARKGYKRATVKLRSLRT